MTKGSKAKSTSKQKRQANHIVSSVRERGGSLARAKRIAYATVNKLTGSAKKSGSGRARKTTRVAARKGGHQSARGRAAA